MNKEWLSALKPLAQNSFMWDAFEQELDYQIKLQVRTLEQSSDPVDMYRCQGAIMALKKMRLLRGEINGEK